MPFAPGLFALVSPSSLSASHGCIGFVTVSQSTSLHGVTATPWGGTDIASFTA